MESAGYVEVDMQVCVGDVRDYEASDVLFYGWQKCRQGS